LSSGATITFGHHALLAAKRYPAILGTLLTIILALIFTGLQAFEYAQSSITIADSVFGSAFFCATGLHGLKMWLPSICFKYPINSKISLNNYKYSTNFPIKKDNLTLLNKNKEYFELNYTFLD
jgi:cytochrome c oxidase subunit 3